LTYLCYICLETREINPHHTKELLERMRINRTQIDDSCIFVSHGCPECGVNEPHIQLIRRMKKKIKEN